MRGASEDSGGAATAFLLCLGASLVAGLGAATGLGLLVMALASL